MASNESLVSKWIKDFRGLSRNQKAIVLAVIVGGLYNFSIRGKKKPRGKGDGHEKEVPFSIRLRKILPILFSGEDRLTQSLYLCVLTGLLVARTLLSIQVAVTTGEIAQYLVQQNWENFMKYIIKFALLGIPAAIVNSGLKYTTQIMSLRFRKSLTEHINKRYILGVNFYKANQLPSSKIENVDQRVTADVEMWCDDLTSLYTSIFKPILDILLNTTKLSTMMGYQAPFVLFGYYFLLHLIKSRLLAIIRLKQNTQKLSALQGDYRTAHSRLITYAEEIAFFEGSSREKGIINRLFGKLYSHQSFVHTLHSIVGVMDQYLIKYGASLTGYYLLCVPAFFPLKGTPQQSVADLTRGYVFNRQLLMDLAGAIGNLLSTTTQVASFSGITARVSEVLEKVEELERSTSSVENDFKIRSVEEEKKPVEVAAVSTTSDEWLAEWKARGEELRHSGKFRKRARAMPVAWSRPNLAKAGGGDEDSDLGVVIEGEYISFENASIVSPDGRLLVSDLTLKAPIGANIMITGPNGCGKSSLFRVLGELWPPYKGKVIKPPNAELVFVPQKPYLVMGSLRDQIIYPHSYEEMKSLGISDSDLTSLLDIVDPARSIVGSWNYDKELDWQITFSGGQKQRVAMARVFYHRPRYAVLDECTSAVSSEVEGKIYETCKKLGITLFTVSHRENLQQYHEYQLRLDGHGGWKFMTREEAIKNPRKA